MSPEAGMPSRLSGDSGPWSAVDARVAAEDGRGAAGSRWGEAQVSLLRFPGATMDLVLDYADSYILTPYVYPATWLEDDAFRQIISLSIITNLGAFAIYFLFATLSYYLLFDHKLKKHPQFLEHTVSSLPLISIPTVAIFFAEVRGYSKLYSNIGDSAYVTYLCLYVFVNIWSISIHDGDYRVPNLLKPIINGAAHHTDHHLYFNYNYGQYFTLWDRIGGSYKIPSSDE
ncbi:Lathosterol oxidase-like, partial [Crotalus adamanteus]